MAVTQTDVKHFLDHAGLVQLIKEIKTNDNKVASDAASNLSTAIGTWSVVDGAAGTGLRKEIEDKITAINGAAATLEGRVDDLEDLHAEGKTVAQEAADAIDAIAEASKDNGTADLVKVTVTTEDGSVKSVAVDDAALDTALKGVTDRLDVIEGEETEEGSIAKALKDAKDYADGLDDDMDERVAALEATHAKDGEAFKTVAQEAQAAVTALVNGAPAALDTLKEIADWIATADADKENGISDATSLIARVTALEGLAGTESVEDQIEAAIGDLEADFTGDNAASDSDGFVTVSLKEEDGIITTLTVATDDIASAEALGDLEDLVGTAEDGKDAETVFGAIAKEADRADTAEKANAAAAKAAQDDVDALEELVGTIPAGATATTVVAYAKEVADAAAGDASAVAAVVDAENLVVAAEAEKTVPNAIAKAVADEVTNRNTAITTAVAALDSTATGKDASEYVTVTINMVDGKLAETNGVVVACALQPCTAADITGLFAEVNPDEPQA